MDEKGIMRLYFDRNERAIDETSRKYGKYCFSIAHNILSNREDAEEIVNDTYLDAWNSIPPHRPNSLALFLRKITLQTLIKQIQNKARNGTTFLPCLIHLFDCQNPFKDESLIPRLTAEDFCQRIPVIFKLLQLLRLDSMLTEFCLLCQLIQFIRVWMFQPL